MKKTISKSLIRFVSLLILVAVLPLSGIINVSAAVTVSDLNLVAVPADRPEVERKFRVDNFNNAVDVQFNWSIYGTTTKSTEPLTATAKTSTYFTVPGQLGKSVTVIITWYNEAGTLKSKTKASNNTKAKYNLVTQATNGTITPASASFEFGTSVVLTATPNDGYQFVRFDSDTTISDNAVVIQKNTTVTALFELIPVPTATPLPTATPVPVPKKDFVRLNFDCAYLYGYEMGGVGAEDTIKREEASALLYRLLKQNDKLDGFSKPNRATFSDVATNRWSFSAVEYMASIDVFDKASGKVRPGAEITRGEASKIIAYSMGMQPDDSKTNSFTDLTTDNKYYSPIKALVDAGILKGYTDNTIKPNGLLTRAEYVTMINRLIGRDSNYAVDSEANPYLDMPNSHWAYKEIMRASFGFSDDGTGKLKIDPAKKLKRSEIDYN